MSAIRYLKSKRSIDIIIISISILLAGSLFIVAFHLLPIENTSLGLDWRSIWESINRGHVQFGNQGDTIGGMFTPPWGILFLLPFSFLPFRESWALISYITLIILCLVVPKLKNQKIDIISIFLLVLSFPSLRNLADGNLEGLVIAGIALIVWGYNTSAPILLSLGILLATIKFQETWLFCFVILYYIKNNWLVSKKRRMLVILGITITASLLLWGEKWLEALFITNPNEVGLTSVMGRGSLIDISLSATLSRLGLSKSIIPVIGLLILGITIWCIKCNPPGSFWSWQHTALLISASMLLAPYVSGNSFLTIVAIGIVPLLKNDRFLGIALMILAYIPYLMSRNFLYSYQAYYWTGLVFITWVILAWKCLSMSSQPKEVDITE